MKRRGLRGETAGVRLHLLVGKAMQGTVYILIRSVVPNADDRKEFETTFRLLYPKLTVCRLGDSGARPIRASTMLSGSSLT